MRPGGASGLDLAREPRRADSSACAAYAGRARGAARNTAVKRPRDARSRPITSKCSLSRIERMNKNMGNDRPTPAPAMADLLHEVWSYPLFEALYGRRSRRFGMGFEIADHSSRQVSRRCRHHSSHVAHAGPSPGSGFLRHVLRHRRIRAHACGAHGQLASRGPVRKPTSLIDQDDPIARCSATASRCMTR